jgi:hypothetical protein
MDRGQAFSWAQSLSPLKKPAENILQDAPQEKKLFMKKISSQTLYIH